MMRPTRAVAIQLGRRTAVVFFAALILSWALPAAFGQTITTGDVTGIVADSSGAVVPKAAVLLKSLDTGESRTGQTNGAGSYRFPFMRPGTYQISAASAGLKSDIGRLIVAVGQVQELNLTLKPDEPKEVVLVTEDSPLVNTDNANITYTLSSKQLELLPLPGGDLTSAAYSMPGIAINNRRGYGNFSSQGLPSVSNLFTVNGIDDMDPYYNVNNSGTTGLLLGANEIQEVSIVQNAYEGQYGRQAGAQVNYVSKSGANTYHGNLLYNYNGTMMNANDFFANGTGTPRTHTVSNQYAGSLGGMIVRDKLFFFADTEGMRYALPGAASVVGVPSQALQMYTFRTIKPEQVPLYQKAFNLYNAVPGRDRAVPVMNGNGPLQDSSGTLGCGTLAGTPTGNGGTFGRDVSCADAFGAYTPTQVSEWLLSTRVDFNINDRQRMFFRFKTDHGFQLTQPSTITPLFNAVSVQPDYEGQLNHTFVIMPRLVNNFIGSASYYSYVLTIADLSAAIQSFPFRFNFFDGGPNGGGMAPMGAPAAYPQGRRAGQFQIVDDISYSAGNHSFKAGVNYRFHREADLQYLTVTYIGRFRFRGLDEFTSGSLNSGDYTQRFATTPILHLRLYNLGFYLQDRWAVTPHLKVTATVRFDRTGNPYCQDNCFARLADPFTELNKGVNLPYNGSIQTAAAHAFYRTEPIVYQPRFSMVYSPGWSKGLVLRGGVGIFSDLYPAYIVGQLAGNAPNVFTSTIRTGLVNTGGQGSAPAIALASANAFQSQFLGGATLSQLQQAVAPAGFSPPSYWSLPSTLRSPKYIEWSFEIQRQFGSKNVLTARYLGNRGYDLFQFNPNVNANFTSALYPNGFDGLASATPDPRFGQVFQLTNSGYSNYNAMTAMFRHSFRSGLQGQISYTWSHALDTVSNGGLLGFSYDSLGVQINPHDLRSLNYSNADYDIRHNLTADVIWEVPFKFQNRLMRCVLGGWSLAAKANAHGGSPFSVYNSRVGGSLSPSFGGTVLADVLDPNVRTTCGHSAINTPCFTATQFATVATQANLGNLPRNSFRGPGYFGVDSSVYKTITVAERVRFTFGATAYNALNHPNFADPTADVAGPGLGLIRFTIPSPSGPYGAHGGPTGRTVVATGRFGF